MYSFNDAEKIYSNLSKKNIHYYLKIQIPIMHRQFFRKLSQNREFIQIFAMIEEIHFILHVANGIFSTIHNVVRYNYIYSNNIIIILVQIF